MHQAGDAVRARPLDYEVGRGLLRRSDFRPDAGVARRERTVGQPRPVAADRGVEALRAARIDAVIDGIDPFDVRAEARLAGEIERYVHAQPARLRDRVDEAREGILSVQGIVISLRVQLAWRELRTVALQGLGDAGRSEARAVHQYSCF